MSPRYLQSMEYTKRLNLIFLNIANFANLFIGIDKYKCYNTVKFLYYENKNSSGIFYWIIPSSCINFSVGAESLLSIIS